VRRKLRGEVKRLPQIRVVADDLKKTGEAHYFLQWAAQMARAE
jgi:hypothetical protein